MEHARLSARVVYGAIVGLAVIVALQAHPPAPGVTAATLVATALAVALAELYSEVVTVRETSARSLREALGVAIGVAFPAVFFVLEAAGAIGENTAYTLAKWTGVAVIGGYAYVAARRAGNRNASAIAQALGIAAVGALLIGFKSLVH
jgi:hypothetical protein